MALVQWRPFKEADGEGAVLIHGDIATGHFPLSPGLFVKRLAAAHSDLHYSEVKVSLLIVF